MTLEANAAIEARLRAARRKCGSTIRTAAFANLMPGPHRSTSANLALGKPRTLGMMTGLEVTSREFVFTIGYHARAQSRGILAHTINSFAFARVSRDGVDLGEAGTVWRAGDRTRLTRGAFDGRRRVR